MTNNPAPEKLAATSKQATASEPLTDFEDLWFGTITVGTPPQTLTVDFDTGISDTFLPVVGCDATCAGHTLYNPAASSTAINTSDSFSLQLHAGEGDTTGSVFMDTVTIVGLTAQDQAVGMNFATPSTSDYPAGLWDNVADIGSELSLGSVNTALFTGEFRNVLPIKEVFYALNLQALHANNEVIATANGVTAIIDTGSTLLLGDEVSVKMLYSAIPGAKDASAVLGPGFFTVPCNRIPTVGITLGNQLFNVAPDIFNLEVLLEGTADCVGSVVSQDDIPFWVLGEIFLRNFYTVFNQGSARVGFATP
ncbi:Aspartic protease [Mycena venus]|uniref:Aspartic protease n=1 Tax=Mycena venus TaxID=2733690 RepID=A0A8H6X6R2_9AGAR|nr:Aspartic protease [Mycena venus]